MGDAADDAYDQAMREEYMDAQYREPSGAALAVAEPPRMLAMPVVTPAEAKAAMTAYLELCESILTEDDYQSFWQWDPKLKRKVEKKFKKKSAVKKLQTFYNVSVETLRETKDELPGDHYGFRVVARATTPGGKFVEAEGACTTLEERFDITPKDNESPVAFADRQKKALARAYHDILSTAGTRARNRAVMECLGLGGGEVTAEEIGSQRREEREQPPAPAPRYTREEQIKIERSARLRVLLDKAKRFGCLGPHDTPVTDGPSLRDWAQAMTAGCDDWAAGTQPTLQHVAAMEAAMALIEERLSNEVLF